MCKVGNVPSAPKTPIAGDPVSITTGHQIEHETDYASADGRLTVERQYTSNTKRPDSVGYFGFGDAWEGLIPGRMAIHGGAEPGEFMRYNSGGNGSPTNYFRAADPADPNSWEFQHQSFTANRLSAVSTPTINRNSFVNDPAVPNGPAEFRLQQANGEEILFRRAGEAVNGGRFLVPIEKGQVGGYRIFYDYPDTEFYPHIIRDTDGRQMQITWQAAPPGFDGGVYAERTYKVIQKIVLPDATELRYSYDKAAGPPVPSGGDGLMETPDHIDRLTSVRRTTATGTVLWGRDYLYEVAQFPYAMTGIKDANGNRLATFTYSVAGLSASNEQSGGVLRHTMKSLQIDDQNVILEVTNPLGRTERFHMGYHPSYGIDDIPRAITLVEGLATATVPADTRGYEYRTSPGFIDYSLSAEIDKNGVRKEYAVDMGPWRRPDAFTDAAGRPEQRQTAITYWPDRNLPASVTRGGLKMEFTYTAAGQMLSQKLTDVSTQSAPYATAGQVRTTTYSWNANGRLASANGPLPADALGKDDVVTYAYDTSGNLLTTTNGLGHVYSFSNYDANGRPQQMSDPNGIVTLYSYDPLGRLNNMNVKHPTTAANDAITTFEYDNEGRVTGITRPVTDKLIMDYDLAGRLTAIRAASGERIDYAYNAANGVTGQTVKRTNGTVAQSISRTFDSLNRMLTETLGTGRITSWTYDKEGNPTQLVTPRNNATSMAFDGLNRLINTAHPGGGAEAINYTSQDDVSTFSDASQVATTYVRNGFGEVIQETSPDRGTSTYYYDAAGRTSAMIDGRGQRIDYTRDILGRLLTATPVGRPIAEKITYSYDSGGLGSWQKGRLTKLVDGSGTTSFQYDHRGNLLTKRQAVGTSSAANLTYAYDKADRITQITYPSGRIVGYVRDTKGRVTTVRTKALSTVSAWTNLATSMSYEPFAALKQATLGNTLSMTNNWGNDGRLASRRLYKTSGGANSSLLTYAYDNDDNITTITDGVNAANSMAYAYDVRGRLSRVTLAATSPAPLKRSDYGYDANGNRTFVEQRVAAGDANAAQNDNYALTPGTNRLASVTAATGVRTIQYDARGNTIAETRPSAINVTAAYDGHARLVSYAKSNEASLGHVYNGLDDRVATLRTPSGSSTSDTRRFVTAPDGRAMGEYGGSATDVKAEYIWLSPQVGDAGVFGGDDGLGGYMPLAMALPTATVGTTQLAWVHPSHMGVPIVYTNAAGTTTPAPTGFAAMGFPGQNQTTADLYYNRHRDYDPGTGRYIQADPIGLAGGPSPYSYAMNNPMRYMDPTGEFVPLAVFGGFAFGAAGELGLQAADNWLNGKDVFDPNCYEWGEVALAGGLGALGGSWVNGFVKLTPGSMVWNNASRRIRRAEGMVGGPDDLHHWLVPQRWYKGSPMGENMFNRPWNLNPVDRDFHRDVLNQMNWPRAVINGAPWQIQAGVGLGIGGTGVEMLDGGWE